MAEERIAELLLTAWSHGLVLMQSEAQARCNLYAECGADLGKDEVQGCGWRAGWALGLGNGAGRGVLAYDADG